MDLEGHHPDVEIDELLAQRQQVVDWLAKIEAQTPKAPTKIRDRVKADYLSRLDDLVAKLRVHSEAISQSLAELRKSLVESERSRAAEEEALAEAELRHAVGEYTDEVWEEREEAIGANLEKLSVTIHRLGSEIMRLEEVDAQISDTAEPAMEHSAPMIEALPEPDYAGTDGFLLEDDSFITIDNAPVDPRTQSVFDSLPELPVTEEVIHPLESKPPVEAPRFVPRPGAIPPQRPQQSQALKSVAKTAAPTDDELAFLRSVTVETQTSSAQSLGRGSGMAGSSKSLKCHDCGTMNRVTDWYCERCGAELSAV